MLNWSDKTPEENGEYLYISYMGCECCIDLLGYCWVHDCDEESKELLSYNFFNSKGQRKCMYFERIKPEHIPVRDGKLIGCYWLEYNRPQEITDRKFK